MLREFKEFITKGNVMELAVAVLIAGAFGGIITSLINDIITPLILAPAMKAAGVSEIAALSYNGIKYGSFLSAIITFLVIAFVLFLIVKALNRMKKKEEVAPAGPLGPTQEELLTQIRDLLRNRP